MDNINIMLEISIIAAHVVVTVDNNSFIGSIPTLNHSVSQFTSLFPMSDVQRMHPFVVISSTNICDTNINIESLEDTIAIITDTYCSISTQIQILQSLEVMAVIIIDDDVSAKSVWTCEIELEEEDIDGINVPIALVSNLDGQYILDVSEQLLSIEISTQPQVLISLANAELQRQEQAFLANLLNKIQVLLNESTSTESLQHAINGLAGDTEIDGEVYCADGLCTDE